MEDFLTFPDRVTWDPPDRLTGIYGPSEESLIREVVVEAAGKFFRFQALPPENDNYLENLVQELYYRVHAPLHKVIFLDSPQAFCKVYLESFFRFPEPFFSPGSLPEPLTRYPRMDYSRFYEELDPVLTSSVSDRGAALLKDALLRLYRLVVTPCLGTGFIDMSPVYSLMGASLAGGMFQGALQSSRSWRKSPFRQSNYTSDYLFTLLRNCFFFVPGEEGLCFIVRKPVAMNFQGMNTGTLRVDRLQLHNATGPVLTFKDDQKVYVWESTPVPWYVIEKPEMIQVKEIIGERNVTLRRILIERYGFATFMMDAGAKVIDQYEGDIKGLQGAILYELVIPGDEMMKMVSVGDCTPENGVYKTYFLRVPPDMRTAHEAVAWTWGTTPENYNPLMET